VERVGRVLLQWERDNLNDYVDAARRADGWCVFGVLQHKAFDVDSKIVDMRVLCVALHGTSKKDRTACTVS
jgi:hypothetical protein